MKHRFRNLGALTIAVFALLVIGAQAASASQPEFESEGGGFGIPFGGTGGAGVLETVGGEEVKCEGNSNEGGEVVDKTHTEGSVVRFTECVAFGFAPCTTANEPSGTIATVPVDGELVYGIHEGQDVPSVLLTPHSGETFTTFRCEFIGIGATLTVRGSVLGSITPVNGAFSPTTELGFDQSGGVQLSGDSYRNPVTCEPEDGFLETKSEGTPSFGFEQSGIEGDVTLVAGENIKVVAGAGC